MTVVCFNIINLNTYERQVLFDIKCSDRQLERKRVQTLACLAKWAELAKSFLPKGRATCSFMKIL